MKHVNRSTLRDATLCYASYDWIEKGVLDLGLVTATLSEIVELAKTGTNWRKC